jgi:hypothetical protein|tara:strand:+ start:2101 stop:2466 length:366 start_codon:yes stop_codon:yes gene_type:complete
VAALVLGGEWCVSIDRSTLDPRRLQLDLSLSGDEQVISHQPVARVTAQGALGEPDDGVEVLGRLRLGQATALDDQVEERHARCAFHGRRLSTGRRDAFLALMILRLSTIFPHNKFVTISRS